MRKLVGGFIAIAIATSVAACGPGADEAFLGDYHKTFAGTESVQGADERAIATAKRTCDALDKGATVEQLGQVAMRDGGLTPAQAADLIGMSVKHYCPSHFKS